MENTIKINEKEYTIKELKYKDVAGLSQEDQKENVKKLMQLSTDMTDEEYDNISMKDGIAIQKIVNEINGVVSDFQQPTQKLASD